MKNLEKQLEMLERENRKKEQAQNRIKQIKKKINEEKRKTETHRKIIKGGVFEKFEREITGKQELTTNDEIYQFLDFIFSDDRNRNKLKEITENKIKLDNNVNEDLQDNEIDNTDLDDLADDD